MADLAACPAADPSGQYVGMEQNPVPYGIWGVLFLLTILFACLLFPPLIIVFLVAIGIWTRIDQWRERQRTAAVKARRPEPATSSAITRHREIRGGTPVFTDTRVPVAVLLDYLADGQPLDHFLEQYPSIPREQVEQALDEMKGPLSRVSD